MKRNLILLVAALCLLAVVIYINKSQKKKSGRASYVADEISASSIGSFRIVSGADTALVKNKEGKWVIGDNDWPADTAKTSKLFQATLKLQDKEVVSKNPERAKEYGMDSAAVKEVILYGDDGEEDFKAYIGKTSSVDYNSTYWSKAIGGTVYRTPGAFRTGMEAKADLWYDKGMFGFGKEEIMSMRVTWKDSLDEMTDFTVNSLGEDQWSMTVPKNGMAKKDLINPMAGRFKQLRLSEFLKEGEKPAMDASPDVEIEVTLRNGSKHVLSAQKAEDDSYYVMHPAQQVIVKMSSWRLDVFKKSVDDIYEEPPPADTTAKEDVAGPEPAE